MKTKISTVQCGNIRASLLDCTIPSGHLLDVEQILSYAGIHWIYGLLPCRHNLVNRVCATAQDALDGPIKRVRGAVSPSEELLDTEAEVRLQENCIARPLRIQASRDGTQGANHSPVTLAAIKDGP